MRQSSTIVIRRSTDDVWDHVSDLAKTPTWRTTVTSIEPPDELAVGEQFAGTTRLLGRTWSWVLELTEVEVGSRLGYVVVKGVARPWVEYVVEPDPGGTRFTLTGGIDQFGVAGRLLQPFAVPALRRETAAHLENLKHLLEAS